MDTFKLSLDKFKKRIGKNIRIIREIKKVTQESLCEQINKSQPALSRYENGQSSMSVDTLYDICNFLQVPIETVISKDLSYEDSSYINSFSKSTSKNSVSNDYKQYFEEKIFKLYYLSTSQDSHVVESDLVTFGLAKENTIPFLFEVKHNNPDKQLYEGNLVLETQHAYFYFENTNRNEQGLIVTYLYPQKNKSTPMTLLGLMISISHGKPRPCTQKCFITSQKADTELLKPYLLMGSHKKSSDDSYINGDFINYLSQSADIELYKWTKNNFL